MDNFQSFVYGLYDPTDAGHIRYVGMSAVRLSRPYDHAKRARRGITDCSHLMNWIRKIQAEGREPSVMVLEQLVEGASRSLLGFVEACYISSLSKIGHKLTNATSGGDGLMNPSEETRAKMSRSGKKKIFSESHRAAISVANSGKTRPNLSKALKGKPVSLEQRAKLSVALTGRIITPEARAKLRAANLGKHHSAESRAKMSEAQKGRRNSPESYRKMTLTKQERGQVMSQDQKDKLSLALKSMWARGACQLNTKDDKGRFIKKMGA